MAKQPEKSVIEKLLDTFVVRVMKPEDDDRKSLCGKKFIGLSNPEHDGTTLKVDGEVKKVSYVDIPAHAADDIRNRYRHYVVGEPFTPKAKKEETPEKK